MDRTLPTALLILLSAALTLRADQAFADIDLLGEPPVVQAARDGDTDEVRAHLIRGESPHEVGNDGRSALIIAVIAENRPMIEALLEHSASVFQTDRVGNTALHYAAEGGSDRIVALLIAGNAPIDETNGQGLTPLMMAARANRPGAAQALVDAGAHMNRLDYTGRSALMWAEENRSNAVLPILRAAGAQ